MSKSKKHEVYVRCEPFLAVDWLMYLMCLGLLVLVRWAAAVAAELTESERRGEVLWETHFEF